MSVLTCLECELMDIPTEGILVMCQNCFAVVCSAHTTYHEERTGHTIKREEE